MTEQELREKLFEELPPFVRVDKIIAIFKQANYVRLADDQSLPILGYRNEPLFGLAARGAQQDMLKAGFKKVEL